MAAFRVGILTSGGDCPGLNAVIRAVVAASSQRGWEVFGFIDGFEGLLSPVRYRILEELATVGIARLGGTILGTTNRGRFATRVGVGEVRQIPKTVIDEVWETVEGLHIGGLICIGGDGSLTAAQQLSEAGLPIVGVPKTIDNDISATSISFGFYSAVEFVTQALDRLRSTAISHRRVMVVEVMGRYAGWIALFGGLAGGADVILLPEIPFHYEKIAHEVRKRVAEGALQTMIVVAEGARPADGQLVTQEDDTEKGLAGEIRLGGIGRHVAGMIQRLTGRESREVVLGHLQRGGPPTALDRNLGMLFGVAAVRLVEEKRFGEMVSFCNERVGSVPIREAVRQTKTVPPDCEELAAARAIGIAFGD